MGFGTWLLGAGEARRAERKVDVSGRTPGEIREMNRPVGKRNPFKTGSERTVDVLHPWRGTGMSAGVGPVVQDRVVEGWKWIAPGRCNALWDWEDG